VRIAAYVPGRDPPRRANAMIPEAMLGAVCDAPAVEIRVSLRSVRAARSYW
jgi:hypothetical protein